METLTQVSLSSAEAWQPLPAGAWNADAARHLLRRAGWSAPEAEVERATREGLGPTLDRLFPPTPILLPEPRLLAHEEADLPGTLRKIYQTQDSEQKRALQREMRERSQMVIQDMSIKWLQFAAQPDNAAFAKWVLFLSDIYVVAYEKVIFPPLIYKHFDIIGRGALGAAPDLSKAISRSPAMVIYLDLNQNRRGAPNENFARELFELFVLGEGNYTEQDIKQAARAFTGYRVRPAIGEFVYAPGQHDDGVKTVFGHTGPFTGDQVIDLAYGTPAAGAFVPHELVKFYLCDEELPVEHLHALGDPWRTEGGYNLRWLAQRFFGSRLFFAPDFRGNFIKSPVQFYLGLTQDLQLDVAPLPRFVLTPLRQMGQTLFNPPNVRGWVGGRNWINSASLAARRTLVATVFAPLNDGALNADEQLEVIAARAAGRDHFNVTDDWFAPLQPLDPGAAVDRLAGDLFSAPLAPAIRADLTSYLTADSDEESAALHRLRRTAMALLESPDYQLC